MALPNVDIGDSDRDRIKRFTEHTDMKKYIHDFLAQRMSAAVPAPKAARPDPRIEVPTVTVPRPSPPGEKLLSVQIVRASSFVELMDPDPATRLLLDLSVAGRRWRTAPVEAEVDPAFSDCFTLELSESLDELIASGLGSVTAILIAGPNQCVYGSGLFDWRRCLSDKVGLPVSLSDPRTGDDCGVVHLRLTFSTPLCTQAELDGLIRSESSHGSHICRLSSRLIPTPFHALRFAGLFELSRRTFGATGNVIVDDAPPSSDEDATFTRGFSIHSILAGRSGSAADISALLCSIFCGFGFEAFVCGSKVLTVHEDRATLWDPIRCERLNVQNVPTTVLYGYKCKLEPIVENPSAVTSDPRIWKRFELPPPIATPSLLKCADLDEIEIENDVKRRISAVRNIHQTRFDDRIAAAMRPLLHSYEASKLNESCDLWTPHVNDAIRNLMPPKSTVKVAPLCVHSADPQSIFMALQKKAAALLQHPEAELFALSIAVFPYAENLYACWLLLGAILPQTR
jgi:hypothetical protein